LDILEFNSSFAIIHQMGEVENTFPIIRETTGRDLANVCVTLTASEEVRVHPGKTGCNVTLSNGYQVTFKSTIDKGIKQDSSIRLDVNVNQGYMIFITRSSCREIGLRGWIPYEWGD
jgi:hypothetical protein